MTDSVSEELVEIAAKAMWGDHWRMTWEKANDQDRKAWMEDARAALGAVAPMLIAAGMREAASMMSGAQDMLVQHFQRDILARAQELDTQ
jgi:hypothetical protein